VQEINRAASEIMNAIEQIRLGSQTAAAATEESSAAINQIERGLEVSQERANTSKEQVQSIRSLLKSNKTSVDELIGGISASVVDTNNSITQIRDLEQVSRKIDKIVEAISLVSIQTNMLAVNGSIEAARAGEYGKGFVVVATDIRNLARDSADNADRIKDLVKSVQDQIFKVGTGLEDIVKSAIEETARAKISTENLAKIESDVLDVEQSSEIILTASADISAAILQVKKGSEQISSASQEAEKASEEASSAAEQQSTGANELAEAIEEIASLADELQSM
jgi:methyl-accepting chemotaxis protein